MTIAIANLRRAAQQCRENRASQIRNWIIQHGYSLEDLMLVQWFGRPLFHVANLPFRCEVEDKFVVLPKHLAKEEVGEPLFNVHQRTTGLWLAWKKLDDTESE